MHRKLTNILKSAVISVDPGKLIKSGVTLDKTNGKLEIFGNVFSANDNFHVIGFGKAVASMAIALQDILQHQIKSGVLSVPVRLSESALQPPFCVYQGAKDNLPDLDSLHATDEILRITKSLPPKDVLIVLISGGGSSLFVKPIPGVSLEDKLRTIRLLTERGASIEELNIVRKTISSVKGGRFGCLLNKNRTICLILSDVIGDPIDIIASGPTFLHSGANGIATDVIKRYKLEQKIPENVISAINFNDSTNNQNQLGNIQNIIIGSNTIALKSAKQLEENEKCKIVIVSSEISGLVSAVCDWYAKLSLEMLNFLTSENFKEFTEAMEKLLEQQNCNIEAVTEILHASKNRNFHALCLLMGGETTVRLQGSGKGGRNQELSVMFANFLYKLKLASPFLFKNWDVSLLCAGTDGIDGPTDVAGAIGCSDLIESGTRIGLNVEQYLANNDSYSYLSKIENGKYFVKTGHTGTNVMDVHILAFSKRSTNFSKL